LFYEKHSKKTKLKQQMKRKLMLIVGLIVSFAVANGQSRGFYKHTEYGKHSGELPEILLGSDDASDALSFPSERSLEIYRKFFNDYYNISSQQAYEDEVNSLQLLDAKDPDNFENDYYVVEYRPDGSMKKFSRPLHPGEKLYYDSNGVAVASDYCGNGLISRHHVAVIPAPQTPAPPTTDVVYKPVYVPVHDTVEIHDTVRIAADQPQYQPQPQQQVAYQQPQAPQFYDQSGQPTAAFEVAFPISMMIGGEQSYQCPDGNYRSGGSMRNYINRNQTIVNNTYINNSVNNSNNGNNSHNGNGSHNGGGGNHGGGGHGGGGGNTNGGGPSQGSGGNGGNTGGGGGNPAAPGSGGAGGRGNINGTSYAANQTGRRTNINSYSQRSNQQYATNNTRSVPTMRNQGMRTSGFSGMARQNISGGSRMMSMGGGRSFSGGGGGRGRR
jgi:hypothetical protein